MAIINRGELVKRQLQLQYHDKIAADPSFRPSKIVIGLGQYLDVKADPGYKSYYTPPTPSEGAKIFDLPVEVRVGDTTLEVV